VEGETSAARRRRRRAAGSDGAMALFMRDRVVINGARYRFSSGKVKFKKSGRIRKLVEETGVEPSFYLVKSICYST
jgi:hypothetical protein